MIGLGTIINASAIIIGGVIGFFFRKALTDRLQNTLTATCGICVLFIGIVGALEGMLQIEGGTLVGGRTIFIVACLALGALIGELLNIEGLFERFGEWLKRKTGNAKDTKFTDGFVTATLTVCIGAMAVVGSIQDGISGDYSTLTAKAILDFIIIMIMTCSYGKGCAFSAIPVAIFQGTITIGARLIKPIMTEIALSNLALIGSILIFCVGLNLVWGKTIRVANLLPALVIAVLCAFLPFSF